MGPPQMRAELLQEDQTRSEFLPDWRIKQQEFAGKCLMKRNFSFHPLIMPC